MGSSVAPEETTVQSPSGGSTFQAFVKNAIQRIQKEAWGRSAEVVEIRNACQSFFDNLENQEANSKLEIPLDEEQTKAVLTPLKLACSCSVVRIVEPALGCLHKLVAYAWIQGESSEVGSMEDGSAVTEIVSMVVQCIQLGNASIYLAVIRALLTFATADHFVAHGHCLLHMVRTVFNLAVSCDESNLKRTACNALLQMLNTVVKRVVVTQFQTTAHRSSKSLDSVGEISHSRANSVASVDVPESVSSPSADPASNRSEGTWKLADLAEKQDLEALEAAFEDKQRVIEENMKRESGETKQETKADTSQDEPSPSPKKSKRQKGWHHLTILEKDVLVVLMAFCKLAGVNTTAMNSDNYVRQGKLLALELLVKVFENPSHRWENVRVAFCEQLRFPLCLVLIRNCNPLETKAFQFSIRLFVSVILQLKIRSGLKAELGALYPLLLLRPLEADDLDPVLLTVTLTGIKRISREPQVQVDLFINYDCNLKAPNLYERTAKALGQLALYGDPNAPPSQSSLLREAASVCSMAMLESLDSWAGPVKETAGYQGQVSESPQHGNDNGNGSVMGTTSEVKHFGAAKERKNSLSLGIDLFNKNPAKGIASLVASEVVLNKPETIASFLRKNKDSLDPAMLGEYLGLNEEMPLKVMHTYIDMESYSSVTIDAALRKLLSQFHLPGEAQKIDRIMEKFAERYCQDNKDVFQCADDAYVLSFSLIMLNTDMHNPMAEKRLSKQDFVSMNMRQNTEGVFVEVLPVTELEAMYDRIAAEEIRAAASSLAAKRDQILAQHRNLASAVGLTQLAMPFRSGRVWDKVRGAQIEHEHLLALTQKAMRSDAVDADQWFTATHAEHSRPMLEVAGPHFQKALASAVESGSDKDSIDRIVGSLVTAIELSALLGLDSLCQQFMSTLSRAIGVHSKEALLRANPHRQISALRALIGVASSDNAGLLGSSWTIVLRTISSVEALISDMRRGHQSSHSVFEESMQSLKIQSSPDHHETEKSSSTAFTRFFSQIGFTKETEVLSGMAPGQAIRIWADGEGITEMDRIFVRSASLDGEAVVVFCKALCVVSQEELDPTVPLPKGASPRVFSLRKLVECAYYNLGRIRLIWGRLWSTISFHLVNASCYSDQTVAMYSVDSLRQLVGKLLSRDELINFTTQSDTLRPFVVVLKQCANIVVRELAVQCIEQAMNTHSSRLGSGWVVILEFLSVASLDPAPSVTRQCIETLQSVVDVHWRRWGRGRDALADCVNVALRVARNPHNSDCSLKAIQLIYSCAKQLVSELTTEERSMGTRSSSVDCSNKEDSRVDMERSSSVPPAEADQSRETAAHVDPLLPKSSLWIVIFEALVEIVNREDRRRCADSAAEVLFKLPKTEFSSTWDMKTWNGFQFAIHRVFDIAENAYTVDSGMDRVLSYSTSFLPGLFAVINQNYETMGKSLLSHLLEILVGWMESSEQTIAMSSVYLLQEMVAAVADRLDSEGWSAVTDGLNKAWNICVRNSRSMEAVPFVSWVRGDNSLSPSTIRVRCQVLLTIQRVIYYTIDILANRKPSDSVAKAIEILLSSVGQTSQVNNNKDHLTEIAEYLDACPTGPEESRRPPPSDQSTETKEVCEIEEDANGEIEEASTTDPEEQTVPLPAIKTEFSQSIELPPPLSPADDDEEEELNEFPELCTTLSGHKPKFHGFMRIEVEGGMLAITALTKRRSVENGSDVATVQLLDFCKKVIVESSDRTKHLASDVQDTTEGEPGHSRWEEAAKAPLTSKAIETYRLIEGERLREYIEDLFPHLSALIRSPQPSIRRSVACLMKTKTASVLNV